MLPDDPQAIDLIPFNPPISSSQEGEEGRNEKEWTFEMVEARLIEAAELWRRTPGGGKWPFAGDGPWHLIKTEARISGADDLRPLPLSVEEVAVRDNVTRWVTTLVGAADDRKLVWRVVGIKAAGRTVSWRRLARREGARLGADALRKRYTRAVAAICRGLGGLVEAPPLARAEIGEASSRVHRARRQEYQIEYVDARQTLKGEASNGAEKRG